jgi:hypothetical protein
MTLIKPVSPGDAVYVNWEMLHGVPAIVRRVYTGKQWINVGIDPKDLEKLDVERAGFFRIHPRTGLVHLVLRPGEYERAKDIIDNGRSGEITVRE